jgi:hypothetical protein
MAAIRRDLSVEILDLRAALYILEKVLYDDSVLRKYITFELTFVFWSYWADKQNRISQSKFSMNL